MKFTPENITKLKPNQVFVFGSNTAGIHGAGAAKMAETLFGAERGVAEGPTGRCYAIPTRIVLPRSRLDARRIRFEKMPLDIIRRAVAQFLWYASNEDKVFLVTKIGCGYAGYSPEEISPMFKYLPLNVILPQEFLELQQGRGPW